MTFSGSLPGGFFFLELSNFEGPPAKPGVYLKEISDGSDKTIQYAYTEDMLVGTTDIRRFSTSYGYEVSGKGIGGLQQMMVMAIPVN